MSKSIFVVHGNFYAKHKNHATIYPVYKIINNNRIIWNKESDMLGGLYVKKDKIY